MIAEVNRSNLAQAARIHSVSWKCSHCSFYTPDFVSLHTPERQRSYLAKKIAAGTKLYMLYEKEPVGIISVTGSLIEDLYVLPEKQNRGHGSKLLQYAVGQCQGTPTLWILENNTDAERLYLRHGFRRTGRIHEVANGLCEIEFALEDNRNISGGERRQRGMKVLVTGPKGFVGARIMDTIKEAISAPSLREADEDTVRRLIDETKPDFIIHTAAVSDIGACAKDPDGSYKANVTLPLWLARTGIKAVFFSSDQVYGGSDGEGPYAEEEAVPVNLYARQKLEMEQRVLDSNPDAVLLRATWMYDMPLYGAVNRGNFLMNMLKEAELSFSQTQHRAVTYVREVSEWIEKAALLPGGVYNYGSENELTMLETARWLRDALKLRVTLTDSGSYHNLWMDCSKLKRNGIFFDSTIDGLKRCIKDYSL